MKYSTANVRQDLKTKGKPWRAVLKYKDDNGKWKEITKGLPEAKGKREAQRLADAWLDEMNEEQEQLALHNERTISKVYEEYLDLQLNTKQIEQSTYINSMHYYKEYIKPYLGNILFDELEGSDIEKWLRTLHSKLSPNTVCTCYSRFKKIYNYYYEKGELTKNPFFGIKAPKKGKAKVSHLTDKQMQDFLVAVYADFDPKDAMYAGILLAFFAGLRREEIIGLRWRDIDFKNGTLTVRSAVVHGGASGSYTKGPKNESSNRTIPMVEELQDALEQRRDVIKPKSSWFICGDKEEFMAPQTFSHLFTDFAKRNNLVDAYDRRVVPHALRHNFATVGIRGGTDIASLSLMMGHSSRAMTLDTYGDASADALNIATEKLGKAFKENIEILRDVAAEKEAIKKDAIESDAE